METFKHQTMDQLITKYQEQADNLPKDSVFNRVSAVRLSEGEIVDLIFPENHKKTVEYVDFEGENQSYNLISAEAGLILFNFYNSL